MKKADQLRQELEDFRKGKGGNINDLHRRSEVLLSQSSESPDGGELVFTSFALNKKDSVSGLGYDSYRKHKSAEFVARAARLAQPLQEVKKTSKKERCCEEARHLLYELDLLVRPAFGEADQMQHSIDLDRLEEWVPSWCSGCFDDRSDLASELE